jgi:hypothetical protein
MKKGIKQTKEKGKRKAAIKDLPASARREEASSGGADAVNTRNIK